MAFKIALISGKGGVGKTTTTVNLSAALAERGKRVLVVDLDPQSHASLSLGISRRELAPSIADVLRSGVPMAEAVRSTSVENLDLVTASADLATLDLDLGAGREHCLVKPLATIQDDYDYVFLDSPATLNLLSRIALVASDGYLVPVTPQFLVLDGLENFLGLVKRTLYRLQASSERVGILLTQIDGRTKNARINSEAIRHQYGREVFAIEIRVNVRLAEAPGAGQTIFQFDPRATGAAGYRLVAEELLLRRGDPESEARQDEEPRPESVRKMQVEVRPEPRDEPAAARAPAERPRIGFQPPQPPWSPSPWPRSVSSAEAKSAIPVSSLGPRR